MKNCKYCDSECIEIVFDASMKSKKQQYGEIKCTVCKRHQQWMRDPDHTKRLERRDKEIGKILNLFGGGLSDYQKSFLNGILESRRPLTTSQTNWLNDLARKYLGYAIVDYHKRY